jgi:hypothetical protein
MLSVDPVFWENPPWGSGTQKYRLGLKPISKDEWLDRKIGPDLYSHKKKLLDSKYNDVVAVTNDSIEAQEILSKEFGLKELIYKDLIADMSLLIQDDLCLIRASGDQELLAASVCSPSYWNIKSKIGKPLKEIHQPVTSLNEKIGDRVSKFIKQAPVKKPFARQNWLIHGDIKRFHLSEESELSNNPTDWFIRSEKETLCRFHEDYSLFTINVMFQPLSVIHDYPEQRQNLILSINTFDAEEIDYFGGEKKVRILQKYLLSQIE